MPKANHGEAGLGSPAKAQGPPFPSPKARSVAIWKVENDKTKPLGMEQALLAVGHPTADDKIQGETPNKNRPIFPLASRASL